jgi:hypothetical protein
VTGSNENPQPSEQYPYRETSRPLALFPPKLIAALAAAALIVAFAIFGATQLIRYVAENGTGIQSQADLEAEERRNVLAALDDKIDEYSQGLERGSIWAKIAETQENRFAIQAYLFILADMKAATRLGADTTGYVERMEYLEGLLLDEKPLGVDVDITTSRGHFVYDGTTGEGSYTPKP